MIFYLASDATKLEKVDRSLLQDRLSRLLRCHRHGRLLLVISRSSADWMLRNVDLIATDKAMLQKIYLQATQSLGVLHLAKKFVEVRIDAEVIGWSEDQRSVVLPIQSLWFDEINQQPSLIVEDISSDSNVIKFILSNMDSTYKNFSYSFDVVHGGGDRLIDNLRAKVEQKRLVVSVSDSDRISPQSQHLSPKLVKMISHGNEWEFSFNYVLPVHEIENVFGLQTFLAVPKFHAQPILTALNEVSSSELEEGVAFLERFENFCDYKKGHSMNAISKLPATAEREWIQSKLERSSTFMSTQTLSGLGRKVVDDVLNSIEGRNAFCQSMQSQNWRSLFLPIFSEIIWILVASNPTRS